MTREVQPILNFEPVFCEEAENWIRSRICSGELRQGARLSESDLQTRIGATARSQGKRCSRATIRNAIARLEERGIVKVLPQRGTFVCKLTKEEAAEIYLSRSVFERQIVEELAKLPDRADRFSRLAVAREKLTRMDCFPDTIEDDGEQEAFVKLDIEFHCELSNAAGFAKTVTRFLEDHRQRLLLAARPGKTARTNSTKREHHDIVKAIENGQVEQAVGLLNYHLYRSVKRWDIPKNMIDCIQKRLPKPPRNP